MTCSQKWMDGAETVQLELCRSAGLPSVGDRRSRSGCFHAASVPRGCCTVFDTGPREMNSASFGS